MCLNEAHLWWQAYKQAVTERKALLWAFAMDLSSFGAHSGTKSDLWTTEHGSQLSLSLLHPLSQVRSQKKSLCAGGGLVRFAAPALTFSASSRLWCLTDYTKAPAPSLESFFGSPRTNPCWPHRHSMPLGGPSHGYLFLSCPQTLPQPPLSPP